MLRRFRQFLSDNAEDIFAVLILMIMTTALFYMAYLFMQVLGLR